MVALQPTAGRHRMLRHETPRMLSNWAVDWILQPASDDDKSGKENAREAARAEREGRSSWLAAEARAQSHSKIADEVGLDLQAVEGHQDQAKSTMLHTALQATKAAAKAAEASAAAAEAYQIAVANEAKLAASAAAALSAVSAHAADVQEIEEVLLLEMRQCDKFLRRGRGLMQDFKTGSPARQKSLVRGAMDNFVAVQEAIVAAEAVGATSAEKLAEAKEMAEELATARSRMLSLSPVDGKE